MYDKPNPNPNPKPKPNLGKIHDQIKERCIRARNMPVLQPIIL